MSLPASRGRWPHFLPSLPRRVLRTRRDQLSRMRCDQLLRMPRDQLLRMRRDQLLRLRRRTFQINYPRPFAHSTPLLTIQSPVDYVLSHYYTFLNTSSPGPASGEDNPPNLHIRVWDIPTDVCCSALSAVSVISRRNAALNARAFDEINYPRSFASC